MAEQAGQRLASSRAPQGDHAVGVAHVRDGVDGVVFQALDRAEACGVAGDVLANADVVPLDPAGMRGCGQQEVVREVVQLDRVLMALHAMDFDPFVVVNVSVFRLRDSK